jgi:hypothetical protein
MRGLTKGLIVLSVCLTALYMFPSVGYAQDQPVIDPVYMDQPEQRESNDQQKEGDKKENDAKADKKYQEETLFGDSATKINPDAANNWRWRKGGGGVFSKDGGGIGPNDPPPDPDLTVPFDGIDGLCLLLAFGILYGVRQHFRRLRPAMVKR